MRSKINFNWTKVPPGLWTAMSVMLTRLRSIVLWECRRLLVEEEGNFPGEDNVGRCGLRQVMEIGFRRANTLDDEADWKVDGSDTFLY